MRQGPLSLLLSLLLLSPLAQAEEAVASTPLSLSAGSQITELQQRLKESEAQRQALTQQLQTLDNTRESTQLSELRQENQRLKAQVKALQTNSPIKLLTDQQQWFVIGGGVALLAALCGIFASGSYRRRRQWLN
ncbi:MULTISPECIES: translation initiation factor 2 [Pseudomonas]|uniref:translation initiation factor 2 n=1 Tax=Pseudomonas TaxID=286 RepID=UPI0008115AB2|nr:MULTISPECIES: translation initiation factor 2 [Pseudomonas]ATR82314.1 translation initiation factor 2 [Pseudomonas sp. HLS-6]